jgi:hypothetical protein
MRREVRAFAICEMCSEYGRIRDLPGARAKSLVGALEVRVARGWNEQLRHEIDGRAKLKD